jgi:UDP-N-acetylmuramate dehydrogenase
VDRVIARDPSFVAALQERIQGTVRAAEPIGRYSTYRIGGPATVLLPKNPDDVAAAVGFAAEAGVPWFALGLGSNILLPDEGLDALVIRLGKGLDRIDHAGDGVWTIGAGLPAPLAARRTAEAGFAGLHIFVGVPGTVGGGVYMNAGCHGGDWSEVVESVTLIDSAGKRSVLERNEVPFTYRRSGLDGRIVLETRVRLRPEEPSRLEEAVAEMFEWRQRGTPFNQPCCGSVFKNPAGPSWKREEGPRTAGQLIEAAGLKGFAIGGAQVSPMHANYFVNTGAAKAADVRALIDHVRQVVEDRFGVRLEPEVKLIGSRGQYLNGRDEVNGERE